MEIVPFGNTNAIRLTDMTVCRDLFDHVRRMWNTCDSDYFPGPQPISIERKHIVDTLSQKKYRVCAKSDGIRFLWVCVTHLDKPYCFLMNRRKDVYLINVEVISDAFQGTILDGELIRNNKTNKHEFLVYDATSVMGDNSVMALPHSERMERALSIVEHIKYQPDKTPLHVKLKSFYPFEKFKEYVTQVVPSIDHEMDGYIFTPEDDPVTSGTHNTMFKWKELYKNTVDFLVERHFHIPGQFIVKVSRGCTLKSLFEIKLHVPVGSEVERDILQANSPVVVECKYLSPNSWTALFVRKDKTNPNSFYTWTKTMVNIQENIQLGEFYI